MSVARSPTLARVLGNDLCSGCGLCAGVSEGAIVMRGVPDGFNRPEQLAPITAEQEERIAIGCPGSVVAPWLETTRQHPFWGPYRSVGTGHATDEEVRFQGSSGGGITALALHALRTGMVDAVVQATPHADDPMQNSVVVSETESDVIARAGSRYAPSSPLETVAELLGSGRRYCFIGKPCDVGALRQLGRKDARVATVFPLILSFFCGGIPSRRAASSLLKGMEVPRDEMTGFRYRGEGWPGMATADLRDGTRRQLSYHASWGGYLSKDVQFRCKICPDAVGGTADLACADAWYGKGGYPDFDERPGRSLVVARTETGQRLLDGIVAAGELAVEPLPVEEIDRMQPSQARRKRELLSRVAALRMIGRKVPVMRKLEVGRAARKAGPKAHARSFTGLLYRVLKARLKAADRTEYVPPVEERAG